MADKGPTELPPISLDHTLAGVGAVGSAWIHTLWACPDLTGTVALYDPDPDGIDLTNLNRYVLFGQPSVGRRKVKEAERVAASCGITWMDHDVGIEQIRRQTKRLRRRRQQRGSGRDPEPVSSSNPLSLHRRSTC